MIADLIRRDLQSCWTFLRQNPISKPILNLFNVRLLSGWGWQYRHFWQGRFGLCSGHQKTEIILKCLMHSAKIHLLKTVIIYSPRQLKISIKTLSTLLRFVSAKKTKGTRSSEWQSWEKFFTGNFNILNRFIRKSGFCINLFQ
jgi:hypothetical protein